MGSFAAGAFDSVAAFSVQAWDFGATEPPVEPPLPAGGRRRNAGAQRRRRRAADEDVIAAMVAVRN